MGELGLSMKILAANKFYYIKGGAERYFFDLARIMEARGHTVVPFAMQDERNDSSEYSELFVSNVSFNGTGSPGAKMAAAARVLYSREARRKIEALVDRTRPDVAHLHNIAHQLSPSILYGLKSRGVPVVQTLHDYKLVCPNYQMLVDGAVCERCRNWRYYNACVTRCVHGSLGMSALACVEAYAHKLLGSYTRAIDLFIAPSKSLRERMIEHGVDPDKIVHLPYSILLDDYTPCYDSDGYGVCFGRLSPGKGLMTLVDACVAASEVPMKVLGDGPLASELVGRARSNGSDSVEFLGYKSGRELRSLVAHAGFVVIPSECYENSPLALYESMALGKPVIGSRIGGIPELVDEGVTGLLFEPGNAEELSSCLRELWGDPARASDMGRAARARLEERFGPDQHYRRVMSIYERIAA